MHYTMTTAEADAARTLAREDRPVNLNACVDALRNMAATLNDDDLYTALSQAIGGKAGRAWVRLIEAVAPARLPF